MFNISSFTASHATTGTPSDKVEAPKPTDLYDPADPSVDEEIDESAEATKVEATEIESVDEVPAPRGVWVEVSPVVEGEAVGNASSLDPLPTNSDKGEKDGLTDTEILESPTATSPQPMIWSENPMKTIPTERCADDARHLEVDSVIESNNGKQDAAADDRHPEAASASEDVVANGTSSTNAQETVDIFATVVETLEQNVPADVKSPDRCSSTLEKTEALGSCTTVVDMDIDSEDENEDKTRSLLAAPPPPPRIIKLNRDMERLPIPRVLQRRRVWNTETNASDDTEKPPKKDSVRIVSIDYTTEVSLSGKPVDKSTVKPPEKLSSNKRLKKPSSRAASASEPRSPSVDIPDNSPSLLYPSTKSKFKAFDLRQQPRVIRLNRSESPKKSAAISAVKTVGDSGSKLTADNSAIVISDSPKKSVVDESTDVAGAIAAVDDGLRASPETVDSDSDPEMDSELETYLNEVALAASMKPSDDEPSAAHLFKKASTGKTYRRKSRSLSRDNADSRSESVRSKSSDLEKSSSLTDAGVRKKKSKEDRDDKSYKQKTKVVDVTETGHSPKKTLRDRTLSEEADTYQRYLSPTKAAKKTDKVDETFLSNKKKHSPQKEKQKHDKDKSDSSPSPRKEKRRHDKVHETPRDSRASHSPSKVKKRRVRKDESPRDRMASPSPTERKKKRDKEDEGLRSSRNDHSPKTESKRRKKADNRRSPSLTKEKKKRDKDDERLLDSRKNKRVREFSKWRNDEASPKLKRSRASESPRRERSREKRYDRSAKKKKVPTATLR